MKQKITIRDVAKHAGVSSATVSYVINGVNRVSVETKDKVLEAIKQLDYQPDFTAISLAKRKSRMLGVMIPSIGGTVTPTFNENPYFSEVIRGLECVAREHGYDLLISGVEQPDEYKNWVTKRNLDGLIVLGWFPEKLYKEMKALTIPIVLIDTYEEHANMYHNIRIDDELGGYLATRHLIERGHTRISFVSSKGLLNNPVDYRRFLGYKRALDESSILLKEELLFESDNISLEDGYRVGKRILEHRNEMTAIFVIADILAIGMIKALYESNKGIPRDYSVVGFDDINVSSYVQPSLTTIKQDIFGKGEMAGQTLIDAIEGKLSKPKLVNLPVELVVRGSTKFL